MKPKELDDHRPHIAIQAADGNIHVLPRSLIEDWATPMPGAHGLQGRAEKRPQAH